MRQRIDHLEEMVKRLIAESPHSSSPQSNGTPDSTPEKTPTPAGSSVTFDTKSPDIPRGATGKTVIDGIAELRETWNHEQEYMSNHNLRPTLSHTVDGTSLLFDQVKPLERIEILSTLPPKDDADWLISQFFDRQAFPIAIPPILHQPTFMREYNEHWMDPSRSNLIWLGLVFSILGITMLAFHQYGEPPKYRGLSESLFHLYRMRTAQCLLSGDIVKCLPYTVETLRFNATAELNRKDDNRRGLWIMTRVVVRAAINMGYHRDPANSPNLSVLQAEYRRRVWYSVTSMDDMASFLGGFPRATTAMYSDTLEPRNVHDWELSEDMTTLPLSRPISEATAVTYLIIKSRLFRELGRVVDFNSNLSPGLYETVLEIDRALCDVYESFPSFMKVTIVPDYAVKADTPVYRNTANFSNLSLTAMYHRGVCTLHRKFLARNRNNDLFKLSRDRCISSALALLASQETLDVPFYRISQTRQMLMLGMMILFLELELRRKTPGEKEATPESAVLLDALLKSCTLLADVMEECEELKRIHSFLVGMLSSFRDDPGFQLTQISLLEASEQLLRPHIGLPFDTFNDHLSFDSNWIGVDFDWAIWDTFIEEASYETGPTY
ncbi:MAG: hypothetical protein M1820_007674 [Bogoriella megaspora]|nr:MAG: hypothetical protein M1820_007674 [Bogoriella megaspora]